MADKRIDRLPENGLSQMLDDIETALQDLKSSAPQFIGGGSIISFLSDSGSAYDWTGNLTHSSGPTNYGTATFLVVATAQTMSSLYANLTAKLFVNTSTTWYRPSDYLSDERAGNIAYLTSVLDAPTDPTTTNTKSWVFAMNGDITKTLYLKFYVQALDHASITVTRLS